MVSKSKSLFSPVVDFLMIGGLSIVVYLSLLWLKVGLADFDVVWWAWLLAFFINGPHFLMSYQIFYSSNARRLFDSFPVFFVGIVIPLLLLLVLLVGFLLGSKEVFVWLLYLMAFLVGWHYVKQAYGCFVVYSSGQGVRLAGWELIALKYSLFPLWWASFSFFFQTLGQGDFWGLKYSSPLWGAHPEWANWLALLSACAVFGVVFRRRVRKEVVPGLVALTPLVAIYLWLAPFFSNMVFLYVIPLFHSLQYLLFSGAFTKGKAEVEGNASVFLVWWGGAFVLAALLFYFLPEWLDARWGGGVSPMLFLVAILLFVNIHHYFLDSVIWKKGSHEVRKYLVMR